MIACECQHGASMDCEEIAVCCLTYYGNLVRFVGILNISYHSKADFASRVGAGHITVWRFGGGKRFTAQRLCVLKNSLVKK